MADYRETFSNPHTVLPVIHVETPNQTMRNAEVAFESGADGAFLISMRGMPHEELAKMHEMVREEYVTWWVGVNFLDVPAIKVFDTLDPNISGVWADDAVINEWVEEQVEADRIQEAREKSGWKGLYFGGVAFKYQREVDNLEKAAQIATRYMDVITTSGKGTGSAPDVEKISRMKGAIGDFPLAIASGISPDNVHEFKDSADCFIVATSLLTPGTEDFDKSRVRDLIQAVRG